MKSLPEYNKLQNYPQYDFNRSDEDRDRVIDDLYFEDEKRRQEEEEERRRRLREQLEEEERKRKE